MHFNTQPDPKPGQVFFFFFLLNYQLKAGRQGSPPLYYELYRYYYLSFYIRNQNKHGNETQFMKLRESNEARAEIRPHPEGVQNSEE